MQTCVARAVTGTVPPPPTVGGLNPPASGALFSSTTANTATSAPFTPAANSLVVLYVSVGKFNSNENTSLASVTSTNGWTFTKQAECAWDGTAAVTTPAGGAAQTYSGVSIWTAPAGAAPTAGTVTVTTTAAFSTSSSLYCQAVWFTDASGSVPRLGAVVTASAAGLPSASLAVAAGSYMVAVRDDGNGGGVGTLGTSPAQTAIYNATDSTKYFSYAAWRTSDTVAAAGSTTLSMTAPAGQAFNMAALEVKRG